VKYRAARCSVSVSVDHHCISRRYLLQNFKVLADRYPFRQNYNEHIDEGETHNLMKFINASIVRETVMTENKWTAVCGSYGWMGGSDAKKQFEALLPQMGTNVESVIL
jgi:hypothetical protein